MEQRRLNCAVIHSLPGSPMRQVLQNNAKDRAQRKGRQAQAQWLVKTYADAHGPAPGRNQIHQALQRKAGLRIAAGSADHHRKSLKDRASPAHHPTQSKLIEPANMLCVSHRSIKTYRCCKALPNTVNIVNGFCTQPWLVQKTRILSHRCQ